MDMAYSFDSIDVKKTLVALLKSELPKFGYGGNRTVKVIPADPASPADLPCVGVNRTDDSETAESIADANGTSYDEATQIYTDYRGNFFSESIEVRIWHTNADERDALYQTVKGVLVAVRPDLVAQGLINLTLRAGRDEQDASMQNAPMVIYWTTITMNYLNPISVEYTQVIEPISAVPDNGVLK